MTDTSEVVDDDVEMDTMSAPVIKSVTTQTDWTQDQERDSKSTPFTESIPTQTEMIEDQEMYSKSSPFTESIPTQIQMIEDQEIGLTSASASGSITTRTEFSEDEKISCNSAAASRKTKLHGDSIEQVSLQVATPSQQSREEMSIPSIPSLLEIAQGIICRISRFATSHCIPKEYFSYEQILNDSAHKLFNL